MPLLNEILVCELPELNGMEMYRLANANIETNYIFNSDNTALLPESFIVIKYKEYVKNDIGDIYPPFTILEKKYVLKDQYPWTPVTDFLNGLGRTATLNIEKGLLDSIEFVIGKLPKDVEDGHVVTLEDLA